MQSELQVLDDDKLLFEGLLYTRESVDWSSLVYKEAKNQGHKKHWEVADSVTDKRYNQNGLLFLPTESGTKSYKDKILETSTFRERLMVMKSAIIDERIPSSVVHEWVEEYPYHCGQADIYHYEEHFGRDWILDQVKKHHFTPAIPEVKKIILEGFCPYLKTKAIETIVSLGGKEAADTLVEKVEDKDDFMIIRDAAATGLQAFHYASSVPALRRTFEETIYISPWGLYDSEKELFGGGSREQDFSGYGYEINKKIRNDDWLPMICLDALASIPTTEALQTLEKATRLDAEQSTDHARYCISKWIDTNSKYLNKEFQSNGKLSEQSIQRTNLLKRLVFDYDLTPKKDVYDTPFGRYTFRK